MNMEESEPFKGKVKKMVTDLKEEGITIEVSASSKAAGE